MAARARRNFGALILKGERHCDLAHGLRPPGFGSASRSAPVRIPRVPRTPEHQLTIGGRRIDRCAFASRDLQTNVSFRQVIDQIDKVAKIAAEAIELPDDQRIACT